MTTDPLTPAQRVRRAEAKSLAAGSRRIPSGMLPGDAADALARLTAAQYAGSLPGVIARALIEADELMSAETKKATAMGGLSVEDSAITRANPVDCRE